jgi:hypothetical protein
MNTRIEPEGARGTETPPEFFDLCQKIDLALEAREKAGLIAPREIGCGPRAAVAWAAWEALQPAEERPASVAGIRIRILPMIRNDTALLLYNSKILDIVTTAEPTAEKGKTKE